MLVLSRKLNEGFVVTCPDGSQIHVVLVSVDRGKIRLGIDGPKEYRILRDELITTVVINEPKGGNHDVH